MKKIIVFLLLLLISVFSFAQQKKYIFETYHGKNLDIILDSYNYTVRAEFKLPDTSYIWIFDISATDLDTVLGDTIAIFNVDCGTGCLGYYFFFFKPKFFVQYYTDCLAISYQNLWIARTGLCGTKLQVVDARTRRIIFYRTIFVPDPCSIYFPGVYPFEKIEFQNNYLIFKPYKKNIKAFLPCYGQGREYKFKIQ